MATGEGKLTWIFPDGDLPPAGEDGLPLEGHESLIVLNTGDDSGTLTVSVSSTEFIITEDTCTGTSIAKNGTCVFSIALRPATAGPKTAVLTVKGDSNNPAVRTLTGTGIPDNVVP